MNTNKNNLTLGKLKLFESFWETTDDSIFILFLNENNDFAIEDINPAQARNFQFDINNIKNKTIKELVGDKAAKQFEEKYHKCINENKPIVVDEQVELAGKTRHWNTMVIPIFDTKTGIKKIFGIAREFTDLINTKQELEKLNLNLEKTVETRTLELQVSNNELKEYAYKDVLTKIGNRRHFFEYANNFLSLAKRMDKDISLIYMDIDNFKLVNDTYRHSFGDKVLCEFASILSNVARESDVLCRFGGDEFLFLLPFTSQEVAIGISQRIQNKVKKHSFLYNNKKIKVTISIGIATYSKHYETIDKLIYKADKALYNAKHGGRNLIKISE